MTTLADLQQQAGTFHVNGNAALVSKPDQMAMPTISAVIPVYNSAESLKVCLEYLLSSNYPFYECIVVNDGSTDASEIIARRFGVEVLRLREGPFGPAYARNRGAELARGNVLLFIDADVAIAAKTLHVVAKAFQDDADLAAIFGSYDAQPMHLGVISQYRNLIHHFVHQNGRSEASTFWAGCGAVRRSVFEEIGGFDERRFPRASIEDIELGYRLRRAGHRILLDRSLQGKHLKHWNCYSLLRTDIMRRAIPWSRLILETQEMPNDLNVSRAQRLSVALMAFATIFLILSWLRPEMLALTAAACCSVLFINRRLYAFFLRQRGWLFAVACVPLHFIYYLYCGFSYVSVWTILRLQRAISMAHLH